MGGNLALQAIDKGYTVVAYDTRHNDELKQKGVQYQNSTEAMLQKLSSPKIVFLYVPAGDAVDSLLNQLAGLVSPGDILVDGGNSYWGDSIKRAEQLKRKGIFLIDCGTSGGVDGARNGACFMAGGENEPMQHIAPILIDLSVPDGFVHTGAPGSGHFVKLVHNGIEFGMLQAIGEGMDLLSHYREKLDFPSKNMEPWFCNTFMADWINGKSL